jgi:hypothetical protein
VKELQRDNWKSVPTEDQVADGLIKALPYTRFEEFKNNLNLVEKTSVD